MLATVHNHQPTIQTDGEDIPLISSYALTDGDTVSVFLLSRKLDGVHDSIDFEDGCIPVTLHLPFSAVTAITRYRLESPDGTPVDPRANNRQDLAVVIGAEEIDPATFGSDFVLDETTGAEAGGLPPGSINLYVFSPVDDSTCILDSEPDGDVDGVDLADFATDMDETCVSAMAANFGYQEEQDTVN